MKKLVLLIATVFASAFFTGCVAEKNGQTGIEGYWTGYVYTKEDYDRYKEIFNDGKHIVLQVKDEITTVKSNSEKTD